MEPIIKFCKVNKNSCVELPKYSHPGDAGMDIKTSIETETTLNSLDRILLPTGLRAEIPEGYEIQVRPRSGLAIKYGITVLNSPGTIDSGYKGEIKIILVNLGKEPYTIMPGERIAQLVISKVQQANIVEVDDIDLDNDRGGGFGHSGKF